MSSTEDLRSVVKAASLAVTDVDDAELRRIAFDRVLEHLLSTQAVPGLAKAPGPQLGHRARAKARTRVSRDGPSSWVASLHTDGFFKSPRTITNVVDAVKAMGHNVLSKDVTYPLEQMARTKALRREKEVTAASKKKKLWVYRAC